VFCLTTITGYQLVLHEVRPEADIHMNNQCPSQSVYNGCRYT